MKIFAFSVQSFFSSAVQFIWQSFSSALFNLRPWIWLLKTFLLNASTTAEEFPPPTQADLAADGGRNQSTEARWKNGGIRITSTQWNLIARKHIPSGKRIFWILSYDWMFWQKWFTPMPLNILPFLPSKSSLAAFLFEQVFTSHLKS